jgi:GT2 family glycosyltransferase
VDNASRVNISRQLKEEFGRAVHTIRLNTNRFFCGAVNTGIAIARGAYVAVLNDDAWVDADWGSHVIETFSNDTEVGSVASLVLRPDGHMVDSAGDHLDLRGRASNLGWNRPASEIPNKAFHVFSAAGSCAVYKREAIHRAGGFDEDFVAYLDDIDLGFRLQLLGFKCVFNPACRAHHIGGATFKTRFRALYLTERNMVWNIAKNMPTSILRRHKLTIGTAQSHPAPVIGGSSVRAWSAGKAAAMRDPQSMLAKRRHVQATRRVSDAYVESLLSSRQVVSCHL